MTQDELADPLAGIDSVNWAAVSHAYGPATDIPDALRRLRDDDDVQDAYWGLYGNLYHQGTRYSATATAVPFLLRLLDDPRTRKKESLLEYLAKLAVGASSTEAPIGHREAAWLADVEAMLADPPAYVRQLRQRRADWLEASPTRQERQRRQRLQQMEPKPEGVVDAETTNYRSYAAVQAGVGSLVGCLRDPSAVVRAHAAYVMAWFPAVQPETRAALMALLATETDVAVRATALFSMAVTQSMRAGDLAETETETTTTTTDVAKTLQAAYADPAADDFVRWVSSLGLLKLRRQSPEQLALVARKLTDDDFLTEYESENLEDRGTVFPFAAHDIQDLGALATLETMPLRGSEHPEVARAVIQALATAGPQKMLSLAASGISIAFDGQKPHEGAALASYTPLQQELLRALLGVDSSLWSFLNFTNILREWNLPDSKHDLEALIN